ncbi:MAG: M1 family metallopeptidase [SAR202 cluster bacterium]|nr:M1 family metallopeptidase [SAR202 cluster bacterium]
MATKTPSKPRKAAAAAAKAPTKASAARTAADPYRLPRNVLPIKYDITLIPYLDTFTFRGEESVLVDVREATADVVLNVAEVTINKAEVTFSNSVRMTAKVTYDEQAERATLAFSQPLPRGEATLRLEFTGTLNDQLRGFYRSSYTATDGSRKWLASTQFEATDARRAFPCWDEPSIKATFEITLGVPAGMTAVSNMPVASMAPADEGRTAYRFESSPRMSTYLVVLIVGDLACVEATADNGTLMRVWTTRGKEHQGRFALDNAVRLLRYMNDYFGIKYPLPKMDHIAIPDFAAGAMENWGAITYRETALLFDEANSAVSARQRILSVVAHEMAHMWFGDLVTMEWWDDLWLNESFASWFGDKAVDHLYPDWDVWTQFVASDTASGLGLDGLRNSHPILQPVKDPAEIRELFDAISYSKGGAVLRMLEDWVGADTFRDGLRAYMSAFAYANARGADLWSAVQVATEASGSSKPVSAMMDGWVKQMGFPVVSLSAKGAVTQTRFLYDNVTGGAPEKTKWMVPIRVMGGGIPAGEPQINQARIEHRLVGPQAWTKLNAGQTGFYRVNYSTEDWLRLRDAVRGMLLPAIDRLGLQDDAYALMKAGYLDATTLLALIEAYTAERDATVWGDLSANIHGLEALLIDAPYHEHYELFARGIFARIANAVGWDPKPNERDMDAILRSIAISNHGGYGDPGTIEEARRRFAGYLHDRASLRPDLRGLTYALVARNGDQRTYDTLWALQKEATLQEEKMRLLGSMAQTRDRELLSDLLKRSLGPEVRSQDTPSVITAVAGNRHGRDLAWEFVKENWAELDRRYGRGGFSIMRLVGITGGFTSLERAKEVEAFFKAHPAPSAARTIQQSLERIRLNAKWVEKNTKSIGEWLANKGA